MINYIMQSETGYGDWGRGPQELALLFLGSWIYNIQWHMELQVLHSAKILFKVFARLFSKSRVPLYEQFG